MLIIRKTEVEDIENIYYNINRDYVRKNYEDEEKGKENYKKWYETLVASPLVLMFTVEDEKQNFLGNVKFELEKDFRNAEILIYLSKDIRGKGYSSKVVEISIEELIFEYKNIEKIKAFILEENTHSIKCFERAKFILNGKVEKNEIEYLLYEKYL